MTIKITNKKCTMGCNEYLLKDRDIGGDYIEGILHSWCNKCGNMYGPDTYAIRELSKRKARVVAIRLATRHNVDYKVACDVADDLSPSLDIDEFSSRFSTMIGDRTNKIIFSSMIVTEILRVI